MSKYTPVGDSLHEYLKAHRSPDYDHFVEVARALYGHSRVEMPYGLTVIGY